MADMVKLLTWAAVGVLVWQLIFGLWFLTEAATPFEWVFALFAVISAPLVIVVLGEHDPS